MLWINLQHLDMSRCCRFAVDLLLIFRGFVLQQIHNKSTANPASGGRLLTSLFAGSMLINLQSALTSPTCQAYHPMSESQYPRRAM